MGWKGMVVGSCLGSLFGGPLGAAVGAWLGHKVETITARGRRRTTASGYAHLESGNRSLIFCASAAAMLAKMAKADGHVSPEEIAGVERAFQRLGFPSAARSYAVDVFRRAKDDQHTIYEYAHEFARVVASVEVRELFYEILWDIACADGQITPEEREILARMPQALAIRPEWYAYFVRERLPGARASRPEDDLANAYRLLGATAADSPETLKAKYRALAKKNHPDALRAQGLPEEMVGKATARMARINAAWAQIRENRGI